MFVICSLRDWANMMSARQQHWMSRAGFAACITQDSLCRGCISRFQDCVICGADIERIDDDPQLQGLVERFIEGHARIKRPTVQADGVSSPRAENGSSNVVSYEDVSLARGSFLIQHAMRVSPRLLTAFQFKALAHPNSLGS